jgi:hypothetical protein
MPASTSTRQKQYVKICPQCNGSKWQFDQRTQSAQPCARCQGTGLVPSGFPVPFHYPFNLTVTQTVTGTQPTQTTPGAPTSALQTGVNPCVVKLANEANFEWIFTMGEAYSPIVTGSANKYLQLLLTDISVPFQFSSGPINFNQFCGTAQLPFPELEPYEFGAQTQLQLQGYPVNQTSNILVFGTGNGSTTTFTGTLNGPVLPGSLTVTDPTGTITGTDNGNGVITGTGITGTINYTSGALSVTYSAAPATGANPTATYTMGCAVINAQVNLWGFLYVQKGGLGAQPSDLPNR